MSKILILEIPITGSRKTAGRALAYIMLIYRIPYGSPGVVLKHRTRRKS